MGALRWFVQFSDRTITFNDVSLPPRVVASEDVGEPSQLCGSAGNIRASPRKSDSQDISILCNAVKIILKIFTKQHKPSSL